MITIKKQGFFISDSLLEGADLVAALLCCCGKVEPDVTLRDILRAVRDEKQLEETLAKIFGFPIAPLNSLVDQPAREENEVLQVCVGWSGELDTSETAKIDELEIKWGFWGKGAIAPHEKDYYPEGELADYSLECSHPVCFFDLPFNLQTKGCIFKYVVDNARLKRIDTEMVLWPTLLDFLYAIYEELPSCQSAEEYEEYDKLGDDLPLP